MKFCILIIMMLFSVPELIARDLCPLSVGTVSPKNVLAMANTAEGMNCVTTRTQYQCAKVEEELEQKEKYKVIQCDSKSLEANKLGNVSITDCVWNGLKISGESLVDLAKVPGAVASAVARGFKDTQLCNTSVDKKREMLKAFNLSIDDSRFQLTEQFLGRWLEDASCAEVEKLVSARYQNYQNVLMSERVLAVNLSRKPVPVRSEKSSGPGLAEMLKNAMAEFKTTYECYTPKVKAEMICAGVTSLLADAALGGGVVMAAKKMAAVVKSKNALEKIRAASAGGQAVDLADAGVLLNKDRIKAASAVLKRTEPLSEAEQKAIIAAHEIGKKEGRGFYTYTQEDILKKARILREAGFSPQQTRDLMESGVTGLFRHDSDIRGAMLKQMERVTRLKLTPDQQEAMILLHELGFSTNKGYAEAAPALLKKAGFTDEQAKAILKSKLDDEKGLITAKTIAELDRKNAAADALKAQQEKVAAAAVREPAASPVAAAVKVEDSAGRKAVLNNFKNDDYLAIKHTEIPENLTGEALEAKKSARKANALEIIKKLEKKEGRPFDTQATIIDNGQGVSKSKKALAEAEEQLAKLPKIGSDLRRKDLQDKIDRSSTSLEMYQKRCKAALELYREAHGYAQFMKQYERDYDNYCK